MDSRGDIRVAIAGVGNCASALLQGLSYYSGDTDHEGLMEAEIGGWSPTDIQVVGAFDIDERKVGKTLQEAAFAAPNCAQVFASQLPANDIKVLMGPVLDGCATHLSDYPESQRVVVAQETPVDVAQSLREMKAEVLVCYLPVGSENAVKHYAQACLEAGVAMINCVPVFVASDPIWATKFREAGIPIIGDDIKSQLGATITHRSLARLFEDRGIRLTRTYQLNTGGNTDFLNMLDQSRLKSKKMSKTEAVHSQLDQELEAENIHIGPSDYVPWQKDNKVAFIRLEGEGFGGVPLEMEVRLSVQDSPNSAGVVMDAIRCLKLGLELGLAGPLLESSAAYMKRPPRQMLESEALKLNRQFMKMSVAKSSSS